MGEENHGAMKTRPSYTVGGTRLKPVGRAPAVVMATRCYHGNTRLPWHRAVAVVTDASPFSSKASPPTKRIFWQRLATLYYFKGSFA